MELGWINRTTLQANPAKRPEILSPILESIKFNRSDAVSHKNAPSNPKSENPPETLKPIIQTAKIGKNTEIDPSAIFQIDTTVKTYVPEIKDVRNVQPLQTDMVVIRGGSFYRGSEDGNETKCRVTTSNLASFAIDIHPVTNEQFVRFFRSNGRGKGWQS